MISYNLARAFRPKKFSDIIGQNSTVQILKNIIKNNISQQAFILVGTRGVGKTTIARIIAKALNCSNLTDGEPCGSCDVCVQIESGSFMDCIEIDAASHTGVDNIREILDSSYFVPNYGRYKVYIIDEVHMLSKSAFNAMLKTLEEPPAHAVFVLATTELNKVPITILSRCLQLSLRNLSVQEITEHVVTLLENRQIKFNKEAIAIIAHKAYGSMRDALSITDRACAYSNNDITLDTVKQILDIADRAHIVHIIKSLYNHNSQELVEYGNQLVQDGVNIEDIILQLSQVLCDLQQMNLGIKAFDDDLSFCKDMSATNIQLYFEICNICYEQMHKSANKNAVFVMCLVRMLVFSKQNYTERDVDDAADSIPKTVTTILETIPVIAESKKKIEINQANWPLIIKDMIQTESISEFLSALLQQMELVSSNNQLFVLAVESSRHAIINDNIHVQLSQIFNKYFEDGECRIEFIIKPELQNTLKQQYHEESIQKEQARVELINNDPVVKDIITKFDGRIVG